MKETKKEVTLESSQSSTVESLAVELLEHARIDTKQNTTQNIAIFLLSLAAFYVAGVLNKSPQGVLLIILVIAIHEFGHFVAMRYFGYKNLQVFFVPFLGAGVAGNATRPSARHEIIIALAGPLPGILLAGLVGLGLPTTDNAMVTQFVSISLMVNAFNLLPLYPLDGGRIAEALFFSRGALVESVFRVVTALILCSIALWGFQSLWLSLFALMGIFNIGQVRIKHSLVEQFRGIVNPSTNSADIPIEAAVLAVPVLQDFVRENGKKPGGRLIRQAWNLASRPALRTKEKTIWSIVFVVTVILSMLLPFVHQMRVYIKSQVTTIEDRNGTRVVVAKIGETTIYEIEINADGFPDGKAVYRNASDGLIKREGQWRNGYWNGDWRTYDGKDQESVTTYKDGVPTKYIQFENGNPKLVPVFEWPEHIRDGKQQEPEPPYVVDSSGKVIQKK